MTTKKDVRLFLFIVGIMTLCVVLRLMPTIELSGVKDIEDTMKEVEVERVQPDLTKIDKKKKKNITVVDGTVYENITKNDKKQGIDYNAVDNIVNMEIETEVKPLPDNLFDWENYEPTEEDLKLLDSLTDEVDNKN